MVAPSGDGGGGAFAPGVPLWVSLSSQLPLQLGLVNYKKELEFRADDARGYCCYMEQSRCTRSCEHIGAKAVRKDKPASGVSDRRQTQRLK